MAKINSINNKSESLYIDPGSSGDSVLSFSRNGSLKWSTGVDDSDSDAFKISDNSSLGTNDRWIMTVNGQRRIPSQPAFLAKITSSTPNATGDGTSINTVDFDSAIFNQQSFYYTGSGFALAPVEGMYSIEVAITLDNLDASFDEFSLGINTANYSYYIDECNIGSAFTPSGQFTATHSILTPMDAFDDVYISLFVDGGTKTVGLFGENNTNRRACFSGYLVC